MRLNRQHAVKRNELKPIRLGNRLFFHFEDVKRCVERYKQQQERIDTLEKVLLDIQNRIGEILGEEED